MTGFYAKEISAVRFVSSMDTRVFPVSPNPNPKSFGLFLLRMLKERGQRIVI
jgi:hypothetical protein